MVDIFKEKERRGNINSSFNMKILYNYYIRLNYWIYTKRVSRQLDWSTVADSVLAKRKKAPLAVSEKKPQKISWNQFRQKPKGTPVTSRFLG